LLLQQVDRFVYADFAALNHAQDLGL